LFQSNANTYEENTCYTKDETTVSQTTNFGSQMNELITRMKPMHFGTTKSVLKLSTNAMKFIFPIRE